MEEWFEMRVKVLVLRAPGTNCDEETARALRESGAVADVVHANRLVDGRLNLFDYHGLVIPGGFSYGDRVRAGAIWAKKLKAHLWRSFLNFAESGRPILGICNGFQVLVELGLLPGWSFGEEPQAALAPNTSAKFEARWIYLRHENRGKCIFTRELPFGAVLRMPVAHSEGRFILGSEDYLHRLIAQDQIVFRYAKPNGEPANGEYPLNPNGSIYDLAGICNPKGNVLGLMPHPERAVYSWQLPDYTSSGVVDSTYADGWLIFRSMVGYIVDEIA
ncbi:MAG: phosphoribosylformylglycinamidine synthase subunit PurQ [archaeon GB-1867-005]|nr:phosphoribosylformylglycinamidine synthase subunit PurQ [Candidatus Culexmicrobium cathedralense]